MDAQELVRGRPDVRVALQRQPAVRCLDLLAAGAGRDAEDLVKGGGGGGAEGGSDGE